VNANLNRYVLTLRFKLSKVVQQRIESGRLFDTAAAECLKPREGKTVLVAVSHSKCFEDERRVRAGS
jgi:hypothetical protein